MITSAAEIYRSSSWSEIFPDLKTTPLQPIVTLSLGDTGLPKCPRMYRTAFNSFELKEFVSRLTPLYHLKYPKFRNMNLLSLIADLAYAWGTG